MNFRKKMIVTYGLFVLLSALVIGGIYYGLSVRHFQENEYNSLELLSRQLCQQLDETVKPMQAVSNYILSDMSVLSAMQMLAATSKNDAASQIYRTQALNAIQEKIFTYYIADNFYRVIFFNEFGDVVANNNYDKMTIAKGKSSRDLPWISKVRNTKGRSVFINCHVDDWGANVNPVVFSVVKEIQGMSMGYIEVQKTASDIGELMEVSKEGVRVVILQSDGSVFYTSGGGFGGHFSALLPTLSPTVQQVYNPETEQKELVSAVSSQVSGLTVLVAEPAEFSVQPARFLLPATFFIALMYFIAFFICIVLITNRLTKPIRELNELMQRTEIQNLTDEVAVRATDDEVEALGKSYNAMRLRLGHSIEQEKKLMNLQMQAQFDLLQAQINPHFLFNVLNVISNRGIKTGDETICEICGCLAAMLRYSTDTTRRCATVGEETDYLERYFYLLKSRYEYKFEPRIDVDGALKNQVIPKIVLQQLVENSVNHGYNDHCEVMRIAVEGWRGGEYFYLRVSDNGQGFESDVLRRVTGEMQAAKQKILGGSDGIELAIGGMGLVNTYLRLLVLYRDALSFDIDSSDSGTKVTIGLPFDEGSKNV